MARCDDETTFDSVCYAGAPVTVINDDLSGSSCEKASADLILASYARNEKRDN